MHEKYNILVLHNLGDLSTSLRSMVDYLECFERYGPEHNYIYQRWTAPITSALREMDIHVVILDASALGICRYRPRDLYYEIKDRWSFIADLDAVKLAFPQDDYHQSNVLDELFDDWNVDIIYSVLPKHMEMLYPRSKGKAQLKGVLTGYVDDDSIDMISSLATPFAERRYDVGQRVSMYSPVGGGYARIKGLMADEVDRTAQALGFACNISHRAEDTIHGDDWLRFLGNCRFGLGCEGGVSIWDPDGLIHDRVGTYLAEQPTATFAEVEAACFPGQDQTHVFSAISPRLFESAMMQCCQLLIEGEYLGLLKPFDHYVPVKSDLSNVADALEEMRDWEGAQRRIAATYETLIEDPKLRYSGLVSEVMQDIDALAEKRRFVGSIDSKFKSLLERHQHELAEEGAGLSNDPVVAPLKGRAAKAFLDAAEKAPPWLRRAIPSTIRDRVKARIS